MSHVEITLEIKNRIEDVALVGTCIRNLARYHQLPEECCFEIELCVVEAVTNCVRHAYDADHDGLVRVRARFRRGPRPREHVLEVRVHDRGRAIPGCWAPRSGRFRFEEQGEFEEGGRGMFLIDSLMDDVCFHSDEEGNHLSMCKRLQMAAIEGET